MIFKKIFAFAALISLCLNVSHAWAQTGEQALKQKLALFDGFRANFNQLVIDAEGNTLQQAEGKLTVKRPNFIHWQTLAPDENLVVSDGKTLWFYNPFVEQVSAFSLANSVDSTPILLLSDLTSKAWQNFTINEQGAEHFIIQAKSAASQVQSLELLFNVNQLKEFVIVDATGQISRFKLSDVTSDKLPEQAFFTFTLPEGVDFDDQR
jgi:outer membrane lipoprotein carrier protein